MKDYKKNNAFTLAEVLITLGIIGVVIAMTLPSLIGKWQKQVFVNKVKYTYSILANAFLLAQEEYGDPTQWDWGNAQTYDNNKRVVSTYILPYINTLESSRHYGNYQIVTLKNGITLMFILDGCTASTCNPINISSLYIIGSLKPKIDGLSGNERDYSREDFVLKFSKYKKKLEFFNWGGKTREQIKNNSIYACNESISKNKRLNCGALIFYDNWQIRKDYPW